MPFGLRFLNKFINIYSFANTLSF